MKTQYISLGKIVITALIVASFCSQGLAQLKVFQSGSVAVGSTTAPPSSFAFQVIGPSVFSASTGTITSSAYIRGLNAYSTATNPDYTWYGNDQTGIFHPGASILGFTVAGEIARFTTNGLIIGSTTDPGYDRVAITAVSNKRALETFTNYTTDYGYHQVNVINRNLTKAFTVWSTLTSSDTYIVYGSGDLWCKSQTLWSDRNMKENFDTIGNALNKVLKLKAVKYNFKSSVTGQENNKKEIGMIAQDVELIVPEAVSTSDKGMKGINYTMIIPVLVEAIKEQNKKISKLETDLNNCCVAKLGDFNTESKTSELANTGVNKLYQNIPNPFNRTTLVKCYIDQQSSSANLMIFDMSGVLKKTIPISSKGDIGVNIDGGELSPGMYYYSLIVNQNQVDTKRMILTE
jgi:hypothetical protein